MNEWPSLKTLGSFVFELYCGQTTHIQTHTQTDADKRFTPVTVVTWRE